MGVTRTLRNHVRRGLDTQLRLAVTGLSQAGKTAFITSLAAQLQHPDAALEWLGAAREQRLLGARRLPQPDLGIPRFPLDEALEALQSDPPRWPEPTRGLSEMRLAIRYRRGQGLQRYWAEDATLYLDVFDYPGEWLLDLPLLTLSYAEWSHQALQQARELRAGLSREWLQAAQRLDPDAEADENRLAEVAALYTRYLHAAKAAGFALIQPGRFILPGDLEGAPVLQFFPAPWSSEQLAAPVRSGSFRAALEKRYRHYRRSVIKPFYRDHFSRFDRQIVLVDCLSALNAGPQAVEDTRQALQAIMENFRYGRRDLLHRLFRSRIDRVVLAATKADHVTPEQHPRLLSLLRDLLAEPQQLLRYHALSLHSLCLAAVSATRAVSVDDGGKPHPALQGESLRGESLLIYPGDVPERIPEPAVWQQHQFAFSAFRPPRLPRQAPLPHMRMDQVLEILIGDHLR